MISEAEKSHNLPSASLRPRKSRGVVQSQCKGLRTRGLMVPVHRQEKIDLRPICADRQRVSSPFCSFQTANGLDEAHPHWEANLLYSIYGPSQTHPEKH